MYFYDLTQVFRGLSDDTKKNKQLTGFFGAFFFASTS
jgi:hypothetical protein